jgi:hypothetical protein
MGSGAAPVKWTDGESWPSTPDSVSKKLQNTAFWLRNLFGYLDTNTRIWTLVSRAGAKRSKTSSTRKQRTSANEPPGEGGPDEAASFIAETLGNLARLARRHRLDHLLEAEEHLRLRSRRRLS